MSNQVAALESLAAEIEVVWGPHSVGAEPMPPVVIARCDRAGRQPVVYPRCAHPSE